MSDLDDVLLDEFKDRELEILGLMAEGYSNAAIGEKLFISKETVRWYNKQIYSKLGTSRRTKAIAKARRLGLIGNTLPTKPQLLNHNLPTITTPFLGREADIAKLGDVLTRSNTALVTLQGSGGIGKTRLAIELGHRLREHFDDGVYLIDLTSLSDPALIVHTTLQTLKITDNHDAVAEETLFNHCRHKKQLLIFDNFEHLLAGAPFIAAFIEAAPALRIVVTSRERLNLYGEKVHKLVGLREKGEALFVASARAMQTGFQISEGERDSVRRIVEMVGGLPLAIILAAAWVDTLTVSEIADEISEGLDLLATEMSNLPQRQRNIRLVLAASWNKLTSAEQAVCMKLAIFQGGFSRGAARKVAEASLPQLQRLRHKSFIQRVAKQRFNLHPLMQQFAREQLNASGGLDETHSRHLHYFQTYVTELLQATKHGDYVRPFNQVELEHDNIRLALDWGLSQDNVPAATVALTAVMHSYWETRSYAREAIHYLETALTHVQNGQQRADLLIKWGRALSRFRLFEEAESVLHDALQFAEGAHHIPLQLDALASLTSIALHQEKYSESAALADKQVALSKTAGDRKQLIRGLIHLANAHYYLSEYQSAETVYRQALQLARTVEDDVAIAKLAYNLGLVLAQQKNDVAEAQTLIEESMAIKHRIGDRAGLISRLSVLAKFAIHKRQFQQAKTYLDEADLISDEVNLPNRKVALLDSYAFLYETQEAWSEAIKYYNQGLHLALENKDTSQVIINCLGVAQIHLRLNSINQARPHLRQAVQLILEGEHEAAYDSLLMVMSHYYLRLADYRRSAELYNLLMQERTHAPYYLAKEIEYLQNILRAHFTPDEWAAIQSKIPANEMDLLLHDFLVALTPDP